MVVIVPGESSQNGRATYPGRTPCRTRGHAYGVVCHLMRLFRQARSWFGAVAIRVRSGSSGGDEAVRCTAADPCMGMVILLHAWWVRVLDFGVDTIFGIISRMAMTLRLTEDEHRALQARADHEDRSMQDVVRHAIRDYIERSSRRELLDAVLDDELPRFAEALRRLGE